MFFKCETEDDFLNFKNPGYKYFISNFKSLDPKEKINKIKNLIENNELFFLIKCSIGFPLIDAICRADQFKRNWEKNWCSMGAVLTKTTAMAFYEEHGLHPFSRFRGAYLYSLVINKTSNSQQSHSFKYKLIEYSLADYSIHALQYYVKYWYGQMDSGSLLSEEVDSRLIVIISRVKKMLPAYRSYAYTMLAEVYIRYGINLQTRQASKQIDQAFTAARLCCNLAKTHFETDSQIIFNASLGKSLAASNTMGFEDFDQIIKYISEIQNGNCLAIDNEPVLIPNTI